MAQEQSPIHTVPTEKAMTQPPNASNLDSEGSAARRMGPVDAAESNPSGNEAESVAQDKLHHSNRLARQGSSVQGDCSDPAKASGGGTGGDAKECKEEQEAVHSPEKDDFDALPPNILSTVLRAFTTPMGSNVEDDWAGAEDPDWKANHQLSWEDLKDVREIGKGLTCTVYTAKAPGRRAKVIAKVARRRHHGRLEDQAEKQLEAEFNVLRQVKHPHVVELLGAGFTNEGRRFLLLEHLPEGTLGTFHALSSREEMKSSAYGLRKFKEGLRRLTKDLKLSLTRVCQVAEALDYLQNDAISGAVVLHRDIRPDNVGITKGGTVKIFDFGLSKALMKHHTGKVVCPIIGEAGSLRFSAPEVSMGLPHGGKADVYSWALLAWSVASNREPFQGIGRSAFYERVVLGGERPELESAWPKAFQDLLKVAWDPEPLLRPSISEVVQRMKTLLGTKHEA